MVSNNISHLSKLCNKNFQFYLSLFPISNVLQLLSSVGLLGKRRQLVSSIDDLGPIVRNDLVSSVDHRSADAFRRDARVVDATALQVGLLDAGALFGVAGLFGILDPRHCCQMNCTFSQENCRNSFCSKPENNKNDPFLVQNYSQGMLHSCDCRWR